MIKVAQMPVVCCAKISVRNSKWFKSYWGFSRGNDLCFAHCTIFVTLLLQNDKSKPKIITSNRETVTRIYSPFGAGLVER